VISLLGGLISPQPGTTDASDPSLKDCSRILANYGGVGQSLGTQLAMFDNVKKVNSHCSTLFRVIVQPRDLRLLTAVEMSGVPLAAL